MEAEENVNSQENTSNEYWNRVISSECDLDDVICQMCDEFLTVKGSKLCKDCGVIYCKRCLYLINTCGNCGSTELELLNDRFIEKLKKTLVACIHKKRGCEKQVPLEELDKHEHKCTYNPQRNTISMFETELKSLDFEDKLVAVKKLITNYMTDFEKLAQIADQRTVAMCSRSLHEKLELIQGIKDKIEREVKEEKALIPNTKYLYSLSKDEGIKLWDLEAGKCIKNLGINAECFVITTLSEKEVIIYGDINNDISIYDIDDDKVVNFIGKHDAKITDLKIYNKSLLISSSEDKTIKLWDILAVPGYYNNFSYCVKTFFGHSGSIQSIIVYENPDNDLLVSGSRDKTIRIWNLKKKDFAHELKGHSDSVEKVIVTQLFSDHVIVSAGADKVINIWNIKDTQLIFSLTGHESKITALSIVRKGIIITGDEDGEMKYWDLAKRTNFKSIKEHKDSITSLVNVMVADQKLIISAGKDMDIIVWNSDNYEFLFDLQGHTKPITKLLV